MHAYNNDWLCKLRSFAIIIILIVLLCDSTDNFKLVSVLHKLHTNHILHKLSMISEFFHLKYTTIESLKIKFWPDRSRFANVKSCNPFISIDGNSLISVLGKLISTGRENRRREWHFSEKKNIFWKKEFFFFSKLGWRKSNQKMSSKAFSKKNRCGKDWMLDNVIKLFLKWDQLEFLFLNCYFFRNC